jgi:tRNA nucleotidyltransferase (CCA-adding enzyme)
MQDRGLLKDYFSQPQASKITQPQDKQVRMKCYLVGGAVRDKYLNKPSQDRDWVVVGATPEQMLTLGFQPVGKDFPVFLHPITHEEYALARTERKTGVGYHGFTCHAAPDVSLEDDLLRRDLTINAMAEDEAGQLIDPYGGLQDLQHGVLRHVSPAFAEDPLRVLRIARFCARLTPLGFRIAEETRALMRAICLSGELANLTPERVWQETRRALLEANPARYFETLRDCGALAALFPALDKLFGIPQPARHHPEVDTGIHTMMALAESNKTSQELDEDSQVAVRWAVLVHDLGKGLTPPEEWPAHHGHESLSAMLADKLADQYRLPTQARRLANLVARYHTQCHGAFELRPSTLMRLLEALDYLRRPETLDLFLLACEADARGRTGLEQRDYPQSDYLRDAAAAIRQVTPQPLIEQGYHGAALGDLLRKQRIVAIRKVKQAYIAEPPL